MRTIPLLYWKAYGLLKEQGLDDESLARKFRLKKEDAGEVRRELEFWFGKKPKQKTLREVKRNGV